MKHRLEPSAARQETPPALSGKTVSGGTQRLLTPDQRRADIKAFGREIRRSKESATDFLRRAGILDESGQLAEPYRR